MSATTLTQYGLAIVEIGTNLSRHERTRGHVIVAKLTQSVTNAKEYIQKHAKVEWFVWIITKPFGDG